QPSRSARYQGTSANAVTSTNTGRSARAEINHGRFSMVGAVAISRIDCEYPTRSARATHLAPRVIHRILGPRLPVEISVATRSYGRLRPSYMGACAGPILAMRA